METMSNQGYCGIKIVSVCAESILTYSENARKVFMGQWRRRKKALGIFSKYAKKCKSVNISENNNTNKNFFKILANYTIWDGLRQKTISRYCPFNNDGRHT